MSLGTETYLHWASSELLGNYSKKIFSNFIAIANDQNNYTLVKSLLDIRDILHILSEFMLKEKVLI